MITQNNINQFALNMLNLAKMHLIAVQRHDKTFLRKSRILDLEEKIDSLSFMIEFYTRDPDELARCNKLADAEHYSMKDTQNV